ncbi:hypothetical protein CGCA056_v013515 [Colletotrichum aenigma]|uniref:uncharacterized protein n=1 Tax=Colletotrichum aenigma TaxID=1215731 RepID=UPI001872DCD7|nr:uncharacterized protein CGCA056_v013515 [Colletotrichum aenigma]KAF5507878.1 hypothetical protein CGCA056_v013515 [Colletotrichum aenigma]
MQKNDNPGAMFGSPSSSYLDLKSRPSSITQDMLKVEMTKKIISPSTLEVKDWNIIMKNCNVMHGWYTDPQTHQIKMAPKPAFILRKGLNNYQTPDGGAIPNYCVNDGSKIDVIDVEEGVRESMVQNSFAKSSVDAKLNGGYSKVSIGMSANTLLQMQKGQEKGKTKSNKTLVGQYKLPRATLFLTPDDLEPTPQLMKELKKVEKDNTLVNIRKFQMTFGEFFAHEVTIGGMLTSTQTREASEQTLQEKSKQDFKRTIGLAISSANAGAGYTRQESQDTDQSNSYGSRNDSEQVVFEAIGGNTILASSPQRWCQSVTNHENWRVIERADLKSIVESMAGCEVSELGDVVKLFSSAKSVEHMSDHIDVTSSGELFAQLRLRTKADDQDQYLVHDDSVAVQLDSVGEQAIVPNRFSGPQVMSYDHARWGKNPDFGIWTIKNRDAGHLRDGSAVTIRTRRNRYQPHFQPHFLSVLRTSAGFFTPCISTSGHEPVWRIRIAPGTKKTLPLLSETKDDLLKDGKLFCLTFEFKDNPHGYRDFVRDARGFRNPGTSEAWKKRSCLLLDDEVLSEGKISRSLKVNGCEFGVSIASFWIDQLASDGTDEDDDRLLEPFPKADEP